MTAFLHIAAVAATLLATPVVAQEIDELRSVTVRHDDLDLRRARDVHRLDRRIARAAVEACGSTTSIDPTGKNIARRCRIETVAVAAAAAQRNRLVTTRTTRLASPLVRD